ncbi:LOW QUALITY PROTEIN: hypothetical protein ACHAWF_000713, partial [Thalassiosira exigua]
MALVLFLFLMTAFAESLEVVWKRDNIEVVTLVTEDDFVRGKGAIKSHTIAQYELRTQTAVAIIQCLYVDDGAFIFESINGIEKWTNMIYKYFARFGLEMHRGNKIIDSKNRM